MDCSPDNPMPISVIGLNYPSKESPNKQAYKVAFKYLINDLLESQTAKSFLKTPEAQKEFSRCLSLLIDRIKDY